MRGHGHKNVEVAADGRVRDIIVADFSNNYELEELDFMKIQWFF